MSTRSPPSMGKPCMVPRLRRDARLRAWFTAAEAAAGLVVAVVAGVAGEEVVAAAVVAAAAGAAVEGPDTSR